MDQKTTGFDVWGSAVASGDAVKLSQMVLEWSASKPEVALSFLRKCVALVEEDLAYCSGPRPPSSTSARWNGFAQNTCLDAFGVVLNQSCGGSDWFSSMKELQLASLQVCAARRNVATVTLRVDDAIPRSLLAAADAPPPDRKRLCSTRVQRLRARRVIWDLPTAVELRRPMYALADATYLRFGCDFGDTLKGVEWPRGLRGIKIDCNLVSIRRLTGGIVWPTSLQQISFGDSFNQPLSGVALPEILRQLTFGDGFNQSINDVVWPTSLQQLTFGGQFDRPIEGVVWPTSLQRLTFGNKFNRPLVGVVWPASLQQLTFGQLCNQSLQGVVWPATLQVLTLGCSFNRSIEGVEWPTLLRQLTIRGFFNQPIKGVKWPKSLQQLTFGHYFNQPIDQVAWPKSLRQLSFRRKFNQAVEEVKWPKSLEEVVFGSTYHGSFPAGAVSMKANFNQAIGGAQWPATLRRLTLGGDFSCSCSELGAWMPNLEELTLLLEDPSSYGRLLRHMKWPQNLKKLTTFDDAGLHEVVIPREVQVVRRARLMGATPSRLANGSSG
ncbi:unnamed protein product [Scytosiphon promiscuus]